MNSDISLLSHFNQLLENQSFFECRRLWLEHQENLRLEDKWYFEARLHTAFNNSEKSESIIKKLLEDNILQLSEQQYFQLLQTKLKNAVVLSDYLQAWETSKVLLKDFKQQLTSTKVEELENELNIWKGLAKVPKQKLMKKENSMIPLKKDKVGLSNIPIAFPTETIDFIFDTGANFSTITQSLSQKLNLEIIDADFYVKAITGKKVKSQLAIARQLTIGALNFENVVFLVFDDADLALPKLQYQIQGIIGFPVISAMEELHCTANQIFVPQESKSYTYSNLALDGLTPLVEVVHEGNLLPFSFDTGAQFTLLYKPFYNQYKAKMDANYEKSTITVGGAGGSTQFEGMKSVSVELHIGDQSAILNKLSLHTSNIGKANTALFGNLGQDYIQQFETMILSFKYSAIEFRGKLSE